MNKKESADIVIDVLNKNGYTISDLSENLKLSEDLGMDSLKKTQILCDIEDIYQKEIPLKMLEPLKFKTIGDLLVVVNYLKEGENEALGIPE